MANSKRLSIIIGAIDKLSGPMTKIASTIDRIKAPVDRANRSLNKLGRAAGIKQFNRSIKKAARNAKKAGRAVAGIGKAAGGLSLAAAAGVAGLAKSFANSGDNVAKTAKRLGIGTEALQKYRYAAERSGITSETFDMAVQRMGRRSAEAANGMGEARGALKALNVSVTDTHGNMRNTEQILLDSLDALSRVKDPLTRNALAMKLFDSEGVKLVQMAEGGAVAIKALGEEAESLGIIISEKAAKESENFNDTLTNLSGSFTGLRNRLGAVLIPALIPLIDKLKVLALSIGPDVSKWADGFAKNLPSHLSNLREGFADLTDNLQPIIRAAKWISEHFGLMNTAFAVVGTLIAGSLVGALTALGSAFWALGSAILLTPIGWIIGGIAALVAIGVTLYKNWDKITEYWDKIVKKFNAEFPFDTVGNSIQSLAKIVAQYNPFSVLLKSINSVLKALTGFDILNKIQTKLQNLLPAWAVKTLGLGGSEGIIQAPIPGTKNEVGGTLKIEIDNKGNARIKDIQTSNPNVAIHADVGQAMNTSGASVYSSGYRQFAIGG